MATIYELMAGKQPGEIKVHLPEWGKGCWFKPYYYTKSGHWHGLLQDGHSAFYYGLTTDWQIWQGKAPATHCEGCEKLRKERDEAVAKLRAIREHLNERGSNDR